MTLQQNSHKAETIIKPTQLNSGQQTLTRPDTKPKTTLERLKLHQQKLANRIQQIESRQRDSERKQETRRKILVGAYFLDQARKAGTLNELNQKMASFLTRDSDKTLFGLFNSHKD